MRAELDETNILLDRCYSSKFLRSSAQRSFLFDRCTYSSKFLQSSVRRAFFSKYFSPRHEVRSSARRTSSLTMVNSRIERASCSETESFVLSLKRAPSAVIVSLSVHITMCLRVLRDALVSLLQAKGLWLEQVCNWHTMYQYHITHVLFIGRRSACHSAEHINLGSPGKYVSRAATSSHLVYWSIT